MLIIFPPKDVVKLEHSSVTLTWLWPLYV